ncbi:MAG: asparagine synthase (glutamine-hydrolyzing) [Planctomycetaceae bacterium]|jgi:asparagine synthase (glutamine-hydrolysing)|nr:asparagine synthase (glutamine-hydrolyzing) [Planctomycetaceae bacterium]MBT6485608.1 asparagine synthase (glutamine-hydrolyzing) [Planctomycetaceae bacterium]
MCGIAGACWTSHAEPLSETVLERMISAIRHRGPDDSGMYFSAADGSGAAKPQAALGHRRLSIIDLDSGHQPLANEDKTVWIAFNGEIYNYRELRQQLQAGGHHFRTETDTETIVHLYEDHGVDCVKHLRGMFAFALWDEKKGMLLLARDRLGQKPLFYRRESNRLLFGSELKSLLEVPGAPRELDIEAVDNFLTYQYVPHPQCILKGYNKLPPAHRAVYNNGALTVERYWTPPYPADVANDNQDTFSADEAARFSPSQWQTQLRETLTEAVELRMRSDVPLGAFLSGGIDSTIIVGLMQQLSPRPVQTYSIGFSIPQFDERTFAREAAEMLGTEHHEQVVTPDALEILPRLIWHYDEPFADSSAIPTMALSAMTRKNVTVALSGDGGDELFAGYDRYQAVRLAARSDRLPGPLRALLTANIWQKLPASVDQKSFRRRLKRFLGALGEPPERRYLRWIAIFDPQRLKQLYSDDFRTRLNGHDSADMILKAYAACPNRDIVTRTTATDVETYLPCDILTKVDIASMSVGLECRSPFLDHRVVELAARMPIELKQHRGRGKQILTDTFADLLPSSIQTRKKMGFGVPLDHWFRDELRPLLDETILSKRAAERGMFDTRQVRRLVDEHVTRRWDHSYRLWSLLVLEMWQREFLDR